MAFAENGTFYTLKTCRPTEDGGWEVLEGDDGIDLVRVSHFLNEVLAKPPQAMAYSGYRTGLQGVYETLQDDPNLILDANNAEEIEAALKERGATPRESLKKAGARGNAAHAVLEELASGDPEGIKRAGVMATLEKVDFDTDYGNAVMAWWYDNVKPHLETGQIEEVLSEKSVTYLGHGRQMGWKGTFDLGLKWQQGYWDDGTMRQGGWEILDLKTHKPAKGFTLEGKGPGYDSDAAQIRAYRMAFEDDGLGRPFAQRTIVARENGKWLEDRREVSEDFVLHLRRLFNERKQFEEGSAA